MQARQPYGIRERGEFAELLRALDVIGRGRVGAARQRGIEQAPERILVVVRRERDAIRVAEPRAQGQRVLQPIGGDVHALGRAGRRLLLLIGSSSASNAS